jgi:hypothetical protein
MHTKFWSENLKERDELEDLGVDNIVILEGIITKYGGIRLAQDRDQWRALVSTIMKFRFS